LNKHRFHAIANHLFNTLTLLSMKSDSIFFQLPHLHQRSASFHEMNHQHFFGVVFGGVAGICCDEGLRFFIFLYTVAAVFHLGACCRGITSGVLLLPGRLRYHRLHLFRPTYDTHIRVSRSRSPWSRSGLRFPGIAGVCLLEFCCLLVTNFVVQLLPSLLHCRYRFCRISRAGFIATCIPGNCGGQGLSATVASFVLGSKRIEKGLANNHYK